MTNSDGYNKADKIFAFVWRETTLELIALILQLSHRLFSEIVRAYLRQI